VAFLDDDTVMLAHHLSSLIACAEAHPRRELVYSHRVLFSPDGGLFEGDYFPWGLTEQLRATGLNVMQRRGIIAAGCPVMFDTDEWDTETQYSGTVDGNEWLMSKALLQRVPWPSEISPEEEAGGIFEDGKFLRSAREARVPMRCSHLPSLAFQVGGRSNVPMPKSRCGVLESLLQPYAARCALLDRLSALFAGGGTNRIVFFLQPGVVEQPSCKDIALLPFPMLEAEHLAMALASRVSSDAQSWAQIWSSPSPVCVQMAEAIGRGVGLTCPPIIRKESAKHGRAQDGSQKPSSKDDLMEGSHVGNSFHESFVKQIEEVLEVAARQEAQMQRVDTSWTSGSEKRQKVQHPTEVVFWCIHASLLNGLARHFFPATTKSSTSFGPLEGALLWRADGTDHFFYDCQ